MEIRQKNTYYIHNTEKLNTIMSASLPSAQIN